jgi:hypothetical protein
MSYVLCKYGNPEFHVIVGPAGRSYFIGETCSFPIRFIIYRIRKVLFANMCRVLSTPPGYRRKPHGTGISEGVVYETVYTVGVLNEGAHILSSHFMTASQQPIGLIRLMARWVPIICKERRKAKEKENIARWDLSAHEANDQFLELGMFLIVDELVCITAAHL